MTPEHLDALLSLPEMWSAKVSPDGKWAAWVWMGVGATAQVYAVPIDGSLPPIQMTTGDENNFLASWTPDSRAVLVLQDHEGDERYRLFRVDLAQPQKMTLLTDDNPNYFLRGGQLHPNGRWLVYGANVDENGQEIEPTWVYRRDLITGEKLPLARPVAGHFNRPALSPTGAHVLYSRKERHPSGDQLWLVGIDGTDDREIVNVGDDKKAFGSWFPDGERVLVAAETETHWRVGVFRLADGSLEWLVDDPARNIENAYAPYGTDQVVLVASENARTTCTLLDPMTRTERPVNAGNGTLQPLAPTPDDNMWVGIRYSSKQPADLIRFALGSGSEPVSLSRVWQQTIITPDDLTPAEDYRWKSVDGLEIQGWLYRANGTPRGTVIYVHGGPTWHMEDAIFPDVQYFAAQGFNVLCPNYRGSTGFSRGYMESIKVEGWGGLEQEDIRTGAEALIADGIAERGKIGITGTSYGGYSSWHAITHFPTETIAASAPVCGMTDLVVDYNTTRPDLRPYCEEMMGGTPEEVPQRYHERSPINFVHNVKGRLMIVQGMQDPNVSPENVRVVRGALDDAGVEYQTLAFDDEGHGISRIPNQKRLMMELATFFSEAFEG